VCSCWSASRSHSAAISSSTARLAGGTTSASSKQSRASCRYRSARLAITITRSTPKRRTRQVALGSAYLRRILTARSHNFWGSRSPSWASPMISFATVSVMGSLRSTNPSLRSAASYPPTKLGMSSGSNTEPYFCSMISRIGTANPQPRTARFKGVFIFTAFCAGNLPRFEREGGTGSITDDT
jgi:hypothetical protein